MLKPKKSIKEERCRKKNHTLMPLYLLCALLLSFQNAYADASRRELKKMCREEFRECKKGKEKEKKVCRQEKRECKKENGVTLLDDLKHLKEQVAKIIERATYQVSANYSETEEVVRVEVSSPYLKPIPKLSYSPQNLDSSIGIEENNKQKNLVIKVAMSDLESHEYLEEMQPAPGVSYPPLFNGHDYPSLYGKRFRVGLQSNYQFILDPKYQVYGMFVPSHVLGVAFTAVNGAKNSFTVLAILLPDIKSVPFPIKVNKQKVGRVTLFAGENGLGSGVVSLVDHDLLADALRH